jgi:hypothetical protein
MLKGVSVRDFAPGFCKAFLFTSPVMPAARAAVLAGTCVQFLFEGALFRRGQIVKTG